jgi:hypothetical protein
MMDAVFSLVLGSLQRTSEGNSVSIHLTEFKSAKILHPP